jgi:hypothetical protein
MLHGSRAALQASARPSKQTVAVAALHTLALTFFPRWFRQIEAHTGRHRQVNEPNVELGS